jgi:hypothetical protein
MYMYMYSVRGYVNVHTGRSATVYDPTMGRRAAVNWGGPNQGMCSDLVRSLSEAQNQFVLLLDLPIRFIHAWELELTVTIGLVPQHRLLTAPLRSADHILSKIMTMYVR